jgi:hypothetical protein
VTARSAFASICVLLIVGPAAARTQEGRDDGIKAFLRGDYVQAAQILRPLAEDAQPPDHTAQFIMGMLYYGGFAGQGGPSRACIMYTGAAATPGPFTEPATTLVRMIREELGRGAEFCDRSRWWMFGTPTFRNGTTTSLAAEAFTTLARGDYKAAADLLRSTAESDVIADQGAQFLMGTLYQSGRGAPLDPLKACALYHRSTVAYDSPFGSAANRLMQGFLLAYGGEFFAECQLLANLGFDNRFEPATFELGPGHSIAWDLRGAVITYQGRAKRIEERFAGRGATFLPLRYTALQGDRSATPRHFIEVAVWVPAAGTKWALTWHLFEVVRDELIRIADPEPLMTAEARPSAFERVDLRNLVALRVNDAGIVEWEVVSGSLQRGTVESDEERRQAREDRAARDAALKKVDWSQRYDSLRPPALRYGLADGCGRLVMMAPSDDRAEWIMVHVSQEIVAASNSPRTVDIGRAAGGIEVSVHVYDQPLRNSQFCTDVGFNVTKTVWRAIGGTMTVTASPPGRYGRDPALYRATIRIEGAVFVSDTGKRLSQSTPIVLTAVVSSAMYGH